MSTKVKKRNSNFKEKIVNIGNNMRVKPNNPFFDYFIKKFYELPRNRAARYHKEFSFNDDAEHRGIHLIKSLDDWALYRLLGVLHFYL